jgi:hypothetical protein
MIAKLPLLAFTLVTAVSGAAVAHDTRERGHRGHDGYGEHRHGPAPRETSRGRGDTGSDLRHSDVNRDGWVTLGEALDRGRADFRREDRDRNRVLTRREVARVELQRDDRNRDGRVTMHEHQDAVRARFANLDRNRDGFLARYELAPAPPGLARSVGWRR